MTEAFSFLDSLNSIPGVRARWIERIPNLNITGDRDEAMKLLRPHHAAAVEKFASSGRAWWRAEQVHGCAVAVVPGCPQMIAADGLPVVADVDGLVTHTPGVVLAIYAADCGVIWLADRKTGAVGLLHSGKKGSEGNILKVGLEVMAERFGSRAADVVAVLSPCIRPPDYEIDFAAQIGEQAAQAGVGSFLDCGINTASDRERFYSYRRDLGKTGRMMAMITCETRP